MLASILILGTFIFHLRLFSHLVSKVVGDKKDWKSEFYGIVGAVCISLILNGVLIAYIIVKW